MARKRTKEISIRRVMGASVPTLIRIMSTDFLQLVLVANVIGWADSILLHEQVDGELRLSCTDQCIYFHWNGGCCVGDCVFVRVVPFVESFKDKPGEVLKK
ncbi:MAG: hypothetical protein WDO15_25505 [Bacteroidota bacterium]